jgi:hypothetical protein
MASHVLSFLYPYNNKPEWRYNNKQNKYTTTTLMTPTTNGVLFEWVCDALKPNLERGLKKAKLFTLAGCALLDDPNLCGEY